VGHLRDLLSAGNAPASASRYASGHIDEVLDCLRSSDLEVRAKGLAILERVARKRPEVAQKAKLEILALLQRDESWLARMNACRLAPLVSWTHEEYEQVLDRLFAEVDRNEGFVAAWALDALARLAFKDESIRARVGHLLDEALTTGSAAVRARAKRAAKRLTS
jgi:hypothetical protein